eukprot:TRINITY_DN773_c0_g1_i8.p1 TRINITY_DN773_c0_g1~~TRINITY_DN773_c0_g1_i8.p1  ORF type:complete len:555 (+),score=52.52 TRINITY_DN773_c0_g1_i8:96-1760(+)
MQIMKGGRLIDVMKARSKHFSMPELLEIFMCIAKATHHLHSQQPPIAHRDLKIENILLDHNTGVYKVCDFGSCTSKRHRCDTEEDIRALICDIELNTTPTYRAPEMVNPQIGTEVGTEADIWALGCTLYKMAYFKDAFVDGAGIMKGTYVVPAEPQYPPALQHLLGLCLNVQMEARPEIENLVEHVDMIRAQVWADPTLSKGHVPMSAPLLPPPTTPAVVSSMAEVGAPMAPVEPPKQAPVEPQKQAAPAEPTPVPQPTPASYSAPLSPHRRSSSSLTTRAEVNHALKSQSSDAAGTSPRHPVTRQCKSDDSVLGEVRKQTLLGEAVEIQKELERITGQEAKLKKQRKALEARLVQIYEADPQAADLPSRGLVASVSADAPQQVEVASFFNGEHGRSRSASLQTPRSLIETDRGPRSHVNSEASAADHWPNVILTLDDVDLPEDTSNIKPTPNNKLTSTVTPGAPKTITPTNTATVTPGAPKTITPTNPFLNPVVSQITRPTGGHRRSASMVIRPRQQQSERKLVSPPTSAGTPRLLQPPPPAKPRHMNSQTMV